MVTLTRLRLVRQRKALTQQQLAERAGVNRVTIARLEGGKDDPFPTTVRKLADALGVQSEDLMEDVGDDERGLHRAPSARPALGPAAIDASLDPRVTVVDGPDVHRLLLEEPDLAALVREAANQLVRIIPDARLSLELLADPDYGETEQLFLGVTTSLQDGDALDALQRFDRAWWVHHAHRARGRLCIDLRDG